MKSNQDRLKSYDFDEEIGINDNYEHGGND